MKKYYIVSPHREDVLDLPEALSWDASHESRDVILHVLVLRCIEQGLLNEEDLRVMGLLRSNQRLKVVEEET